jgi:glycosyltransferase involved in cell wall biosynthesis
VTSGRRYASRAVPVDEPIRVLRVIARLNVGGPALHVSYLSSELDKIGYETTLVAGSVGAGEGSMEYIARDRGIEPVFLPELQREISKTNDMRAVQALVRMIRQLRPHILHTHTAKAGAVGRTAALLAGQHRPQAIVHTFHGHVLRGYFEPAKTQAFRTVERTLARSTDALIAVSPEVRDDLVALGVAPRERIRVIRLGLDLERRTAAPPDARERERAVLGIPPERFLIGWLGRMTEIKRVDVLLGAFARLRAEGVEADLLLVGDGPLRAELEHDAAALGIADRTHFAGYRSDVGPIYSAIDAVALTSANEGTPVTVIEALAAGVPAVSTDVGGVADVVPDGRAGFLVPVGDVDGIAERLQALAEDRDLRVRLGRGGAEWVRARYSVPRLVGDVDALYRALLEAPRRRIPPALTPPLAPVFSREARKRIPRAQRALSIVLLSQYFPPEVGATQSRIQSFAEYLHERGHRVTVIAEFPNHPFGVVPEHYRGHLVDDDRSNGYRVLRVWAKASEEKTQRTRLAFYLSYSALATAMAPRTGPADVVVATSPPLFTALAGAALARLKRAPFVLDVRDLWPAAAEALDQISGGWMRRGALTAERWLYRESAAVVAVTESFCAHIDTLRRSPPPTELIPNGTLEMFFEAECDPAVRAELGAANGEFLVTFAGTHGIAQALPKVVDAAALLGNGIEFAFVGEGPMKHALEEQTVVNGITNVHFHQQVPMVETPRILASSDALLVPLSGHPTFKQFVPSKMVDYMAVGRPVLLSAQGESARLLGEAGAGIVVSPEDPQALAEAIRWLVEHPAEAEAMGDRGRAFAGGRLRSVQAERLERLLLNVVR